MTAPPWMPNGVVGWPPAGFSGGIHSRLLGFVKTALLRQLVPADSLVCDLFCGRGLDTERWAAAGIGQYVGVDLSASALEEAQEQWEQHERPFPAVFCELDPCMVDLEEHLQDKGLPADIVSCLSHLPDAFTSEEMVKRLLRNVEAVLKPGGFFFGTAPDSSTIWYKYQKAVQEAVKAGSLRVNGALPPVRTDIYKITFDDDRFHAFGSKYQMRFNDDGLPAQPQLLVHFPSLIRLAKEVGLECVEIQNLLEFYEDYSGPFSDVLRSCCGSSLDHKGVPVLDAKGRLNGQALDVLSLYTTFIFKKGDSATSNIQDLPPAEPVFKASNSAAKYLTNFPSQHSETVSYSAHEDPARKEEQLAEVEDHSPLVPTSTAMSNIQENQEPPQQDPSPHNSKSHIVDPVDVLSGSKGISQNWQEREEGLSEAMQEASAGQNTDENVGALDNHTERIHIEEDTKRRHSSGANLAQMGTVGEDGQPAAEQISELAMGNTESQTWPSKEASHSSRSEGARASSSTDLEPHPDISATRVRRTSRGSTTSGPPTSTEPEQVSLMEIKDVEEPAPADHRAKQSNDEIKSLDDSKRGEKQQESTLADESNPKPSLRRMSTESLDDSSRGEQHHEPPLADHSPKHYMRRASDHLEESSRSESQQESLSQGDHTSKHYFRRTSDSQDEGTRSEKQQEQPVANSTSKRHPHRTHESLDRSNRRDKQKDSPLADRTSRHYERRTHENPDDRSRTPKKQEPPLPTDNASKHYMRRTHYSSDESNRSERAVHGERGRVQISGRSQWAGRSSSRPDSDHILESSQGGRSSRAVLEKFPATPSKPNAVRAPLEEDLTSPH